MSFFELQYEALQEKEKNAIYVENAISWDGRRFSQESISVAVRKSCIKS